MGAQCCVTTDLKSEVEQTRGLLPKREAHKGANGEPSDHHMSDAQTSLHSPKDSFAPSQALFTKPSSQLDGPRESWICPHPSLQVNSLMLQRIQDHSSRKDPTVRLLAGLETRVVSKGPETSRYFGQILQGKRHGMGQLFSLPQQTLVVGQFEADSPNGRCQIYYGNGDYFCGEVSRGKLSKGRLLLFSGEEYDGEFKDDLRHGKGCITYPDGSVVFGEFVRGTLSGRAKVIATDGTISFRTFS